MTLLQGGTTERPLPLQPRPVGGDRDSALSLSLIADAGERVFAAGLALLITVDLVIQSFGLSLSAQLESLGRNLLAVLAVFGVVVGMVRARHTGEASGVRWWYALPLLVPLLPIALRAEVPLAYRAAIVIGSAAFAGGLLWGDVRPGEAQPSWRAASQRHLAAAALALAAVFALHGLERTTLVVAVQVAAGGYLVLVAPGIQLACLFAPEASALERLGWGLALSMAAVPVALMWLVWVGVPPQREAILGAAAALTAMAACLAHFVPDRFRP